MNSNSRSLLETMLASRRIAVVGVSEDVFKPSHRIAQYLIDAGYNVVPVNPNLSSVLGLTCYPNLEAIPETVDLVNVFRRAEFIPDIVRHAIAINAKGVWVQTGIRSSAAASVARSAGIDYIEDRCIMIEHAGFSRGG